MLKNFLRGFVNAKKFLIRFVNPKKVLKHL
jgi:hypothetical protein